MDFDSITGIVAVVLALGMPVFIVGIIFFFIFRSNAEKQKTLRMAIEKSDTLPPEFLESLKTLQKKPKTPANDLRAGLILMAIAAGLVVLDAAGHGWTVGSLSGIAAIPGFIGVALLILGIIGSRKN
ncbi:hypothetical protein AEAC466_08665 [Asticcacaulis sp. AC466]|uniref:DUF6249 domain-containing protein n=1 Tax=Asticcacaulis sp. AC466 TaxID=1282362 RepID=UPI0003C3EB01|nr:DUF6249 domain-containing protein [Asticcacaulis sp. AC466]ESQ84415.1 hypothetical protein AEAC466_08665 [Asticcacaulis sp. AC466]